jgi:hypothetical protein
MAKKEKTDLQLVMYTAADGRTKIQVNMDPTLRTAWLTQAQLVDLFQSSKSNISEHIKHILQEGELEEGATVRNFRTVQPEGTRQVEREVTYYNLDMILAIGYRVRSIRGTQFRKWATEILEEYIRKGFAMNDELLKQAGGGSYFKELLTRIRDIRSSEKVFYRQVLDLFATSIDYNAKSEIAITFFKEMQNKLHFAVHGNTAAELIVARANADSPFMGLMAFKGTRPQKEEVLIAKNYLNESEIKTLNLMVSSYLDSAELKAEQEIPMKMADWVKELERFLNYQNKPILQNAGKISHEQAMEIASDVYDAYIKKSSEELTHVERDFLETIQQTYKLLEGKKRK